MISRLSDRIAIHSIPLHSSSPSSPSLVPKISVHSDMDDVNSTHAIVQHNRDNHPCFASLHNNRVLDRLVSHDMVARPPGKMRTSPVSSL
jgi:hypothetical protein